MNLDGNMLAEKIYSEIDLEINLLNKYGITPGLGIVLVGRKPDSLVYVSMKKKRAKEHKINTYLYRFEHNVDEQEVVNQIKDMNNNNNIHGILIQLPLPKHLNTSRLINLINPNKDVDGIGSENIAKLSVNDRANFVPCTPAGCMDILEYYNIDVMGKHAVVIGNSRIVGLPLSLILLNKGATVSICNHYTKNLEKISSMADILFSATGNPGLIKNNMLKKGSVVIDIGITKRKTKDGHKILGDVDYSNVKNKVSYITPVPGGVGPMTIARLLKHIVRSAKKLI